MTDPIQSARALGVAIGIATLLGVTGLSRAEDQPALAGDHESGIVLVRFSSELPAATLEAAANRLGATIESRNDALDYVKLRLDGNRSISAAVSALLDDPTVVWAEPNYHCRAFGVADAPQEPMLLPLSDALPTGENQWGLFRAGIPWLWRQGGVPGEGVLIAIVDTGIDDFLAPHPELAANLHTVGRDFVDDDDVPTDVGAARGHGTHVAGIVAAASNGTGTAGVAYGAKIMVVRVLDCSAGSDCPGTYADMADGIQFAADHGARVINLSLGGSAPSEVLRAAVQYAIHKGSIVVAAAGNDGLDHPAYPARYTEVIAVGASDSLDHVASFSNYGDELDLVAPGTRIWSSVPGPGYARSSGTSQAAPLVSGVAAVVAGRHPNITQLEMERYLVAHAIPLGGADGERDGAGRLGFLRLEDWSDLPEPYSAAQHGNFLWEWLGRDASAEVSISDPLDADFRPNLGGAGHRDGHDDGVFPLSLARLPFLPPHISAPTATMDVGMTVSRHDGPRYGAAQRSLHLDTWIDWNSDGSFTGPSEHIIADHVEDPATWPGNTKHASLDFEPLDTHILGNPLTVRARLAYGESAGSPDAPSKFGEVEDYSLVNFVEDFDLPHLYTVTDSWGTASDPDGPCAHHGSGGLAKSAHPAIGLPCNGIIERINVMATPDMDWTEFTEASLKFWFCHGASPCSPHEDRCRVRIDVDGVKTNLGPIPLGSGTIEIGLGPFVGGEVVRVEFVEETDRNGYLMIDDVTIVAFDHQAPKTITSLALNRTGGEDEVDLSWIAVTENDPGSGPNAETTAHVYDVRYATTPIATEAEWTAALRIDPRDVTTGAVTLVPASPDEIQSASVTGPSAFQAYHFAMRAQDETNHTAALSNSPGVTSEPSLGVTVSSLDGGTGAPGDTVTIPWEIANDGDAPDQYAITGESARGWPLVDLPSLVRLDAEAEEEFFLRVAIPQVAGEGQRDTITLVATSLSDASVSDQDDAIVMVGLDPSEVADASSPEEPLRMLGSHPVATRLDLEVQLERLGPVSVRIYAADGRLAQTVLDEIRPAGRHRISWDLQTDGARLSSGTYFLDARLAGDKIVRRLVVLR
jgi:hypothetical protein